MSRPEGMPQWAWDKALTSYEDMPLVYRGWDETEVVAWLSKAILAAVEEEREACALAAYSVPHYTMGSGKGDLDERGQLRPGSPYDAGRYEAAAAIRARKGA